MGEGRERENWVIFYISQRYIIPESGLESIDIFDLTPGAVAQTRAANEATLFWNSGLTLLYNGMYGDIYLFIS